MKRARQLPLLFSRLICDVLHMIGLTLTAMVMSWLHFFSRTPLFKSVNEGKMRTNR